MNALSASNATFIRNLPPPARGNYGKLPLGIAIAAPEKRLKGRKIACIVRMAALR